MPNLQFNISSLSPLFEYLKKQRETEKNRRVFEIAITFILISFFLYFAIRPTVLTISTLIGDIKSKEILSKKMTTKIDQVITAQENFSAIQEKYYLVEEAMPSTPNYVGAKQQVDNISSQNDILQDKILFAQSDKNYFSTQISTSSSFTGSLNFLTTLLHVRRLIDIPQINFDQTKDTQSMGKVKITLPIDIYYWSNNNEKK